MLLSAHIEWEKFESEIGLLNCNIIIELAANAINFGNFYFYKKALPIPYLNRYPATIVIQSYGDKKKYSPSTAP